MNKPTEEQKKFAVWIKGSPVYGYDQALWRVDAFGQFMFFWAYGDRSHLYGWEMDHFPVPKCMGGLDDVSNLRPLNWLTNARLGANGGLIAALFGLSQAGMQNSYASPPNGLGGLYPQSTYNTGYAANGGLAGAYPMGGLSRLY
ncbi:hypothetical protein ABMY26_13680 [Azospirillum sp. HJ39]|uniref:hypothetical protein n=1 Tax=Azospirillum sp. HJ39 TaxID=3159496 RepID=UPI0035566BF3